tara:strand:- start:3946 stop:4869 length:924 start_codon:yes stop_codon:yes gene_type:complete
MSKKSISINPDFFNLKKKKKDKKQKPSFKKNKLKPNDVKKKLIARIKEHQKREKQKEIEENQKKDENTFENEFQSTLSYLEEMKKKKRKQKIEKEKRKTLKNRQKIAETQIEPTQNNIQVDINPMNEPVRKDPPYGCLKGGSKPTWKQYNKTLKNNKKEILNEFQNKPLLNFNLSVNEEFSERKDKLQELKSKFQGISEVVKPKKHKIKTKRRRRKITLGKNRHKNIVGVLVKSKKTRRIIKNEVNVLKRKSINEVKSYLRKHNLIKIGSNAPDHIFRSIYESAYLTGDIKNKNADVLLHNWNEDEI